MARWLALSLSFLFHPAIMPVVGSAAVLFFSPYHIPAELFFYTLFFVFGGTYLFPGIVTFIFYKFGLVSSMQLHLREDRRWPYLAGLLFYYFTATSLKQFPLPVEIHKIVLGVAWVIVMAILLLRWTKVSMHLAGMGAMVALLIYLSLTYEIHMLEIIALAILAAGLVGSARLALNAHTHLELLLGFVFGFGCVSVTLLV
ncbi:MAG: hypothetical protein LAT76_01135 [Schleiferiaceae bacterium]|nr:hypothetical protein [Schleiferiaceae bacterium]